MNFNDLVTFITMNVKIVIFLFKFVTMQLWYFNSPQWKTNNYRPTFRRRSMTYSTVTTEFLWEQMVAAMGSSRSNNWKPVERMDAINFYKFMWRVAKALHPFYKSVDNGKVPKIPEGELPG